MRGSPPLELRTPQGFSHGPTLLGEASVLESKPPHTADLWHRRHSCNAIGPPWPEARAIP